jgi:predicted phage tail component-like protein
MFKLKDEHATVYFDKVLAVKRGMTAPSNPKLEQVSGKPGAYFFGTEEDVYEIEVEVFIKGTDREDLWAKVRRANAWLKSKVPVKLEFDDEPGFYYMVVCVDNLDFDEVLEYGFGTIRFIAPDPYRFGATLQQRVSSAGASFMRDGIRHREDGTEVTENFPYFKPGKFGDAILVEEGTTNLLTTAAQPAEEVLNLTTGNIYSVSTVGGTATIKHLKSYVENKTLDKPGTTVSIRKGLGGTDFDADPGAQLTDVEVLVNGDLRLKKEGVAVYADYETDAQFNQGTKTNVVSVNDTLELSNQPGWEVVTPFSNYTAEGWVQYGSSSDVTLTQNAGYLTINKTGSSSAGVRFNVPEGKIIYPSTVAFRAKVSGSMSFWSGDGVAGSGTRIDLPSTNGVYKWFWIRLTSTSSATLYVDGVQTSTTIVYGQSSAARIYQLYGTGTNTGTIDVDTFYIDYNYDKGMPQSAGADASGTWVGSWTSPEINLSGVVKAGTTSISLSKSIGTDQTLTVRVQYGTNTGGSTTWDGTSYTISGNGSLPGINVGDSLINRRARFIADFTSKDPGNSPQLILLNADIQSAFKSSGTYLSEPLDISAVHTVLSSEFTHSSSGIGSVSFSGRKGTYDAGTDTITWGSWQALTSGTPLADVNPGDVMTDKRYQIKITVNPGNNGTTSPTVSYVDFVLNPGYATPKVVNLPSVNVSDIGQVLNSLFDWVETKPTNTNIDFEYSLDGKNTWNPITKGSSFVSGDLTGKTLDVRYTLSTTDYAVTPTLSTVDWEIGQQNGATVKPVTGVVKFIPSVDVQRWQVEEKPYATHWALGTRNPETAQIYVGDVVTDLEAQGTIAFWAYEDGRDYLRYLLDSDSLPNRFSFYKSSDTDYELRVNNTILTTLQVTEPMVGWHHWAIRWQSNTIQVLRDGIIAATETATDLSFGAIDRFHLGNNRDGDYHWNNLIEDFYISKAYLSDSQIAALQTAPAVPDSNTVAIIPFDGELSGVGQSEVSISGTAETRPVFTVTFATQALFFKVSNGTDYVLVDRTFNTGDVLEIDCVEQVCKLNGDRNLAMPYVTFDSDFFALRPNGQILVTPEGVANVDVTFTERWL